MRALIQRVQWARVSVGEELVGEIGPGILTFLGVTHSDDESKTEAMVSKILRLRIFEDEEGKMNRSVQDVSGQHLIVSQFTLYGDARKGNRPSFVEASAPELAEKLYLLAVEKSRAQGVRTEAGRFRAEMEVSLLNHGPVTLMLEL